MRVKELLRSGRERAISWREVISDSEDGCEEESRFIYYLSLFSF